MDKVHITAKLNPFDHEDDVVLELFEQGQEILGQLTLASRHYVAQRKSIQQLEKENTRLKQEREQIAEVTTKAVEQQVTSKVTNKLVTSVADAFANLDDVYTDQKLAGVQALLNKNGLSRSQDFFKGEQVQINNEIRNALEVFIDFEFTGEGTYTIFQSQFIWKDRDETFRKAKAEKTTETLSLNGKVVLKDQVESSILEENHLTEENTNLVEDNVGDTVVMEVILEPEKKVEEIVVEGDSQGSEENVVEPAAEEVTQGPKVIVEDENLGGDFQEPEVMAERLAGEIDILKPQEQVVETAKEGGLKETIVPEELVAEVASGEKPEFDKITGNIGDRVIQA
jgi:regulator of replication initiation timing